MIFEINSWSYYRHVKNGKNVAKFYPIIKKTFTKIIRNEINFSEVREMVIF